MTELTESNKANNNYDETKCPSCKLLYNEDIRIPRILLNCGHTICSNCISNSINSSTILKCPEDLTEYPNINALSSFPINKALMKLLHKISENNKKEKKRNSELNILNNYNYPDNSPESSPDKGLNTARTSRQNLESLKLNTLSNSNKNIKCSEHPNRNLEMICLEEICKICTNCAIFGQHKNHNVINIDEFVKDVECKADKLIELYENINEGSIKKDLAIINEKSKKNLGDLLDLVNEKYNYMGNIIHDFTQKLIEKVKKDENLLLSEISSQFDKLKGRIKYYLELPDRINNNVKDWQIKVQDKMNFLNEVKDLSDECLKFVDCYGENLFNKLIKGGNSIISDVQKVISFPTDEIQEEIKNLNLTIEKQILNQEFFHINKKLDFGDLCEKYEIPKKEEEKTSSYKNINNNKSEIIKEYKEITNFGDKGITDIKNNNIDNNCKNKNGEINDKNNDNISNDDNSNILNIKQLNNVTQDTDNGIQPCDKSKNDKLNLFLQKEMEIENIQFGDDSFLFTDLDSIALDFDIKNKNSKNSKIDEIPHVKKGETLKSINTLNLHEKKTHHQKASLNDLKPRKSVDHFNLISHRNNNNTYDRDDKDSFDTYLKKTPTMRKKVIKKTKSNINFNKSPCVNKSKSKSKSKLSHKLSKDTKSLRTLSPFGVDISYIKNIFKKNDKINLSRNELSEEMIINVAEQVKKNKDKIKEIKLIKCGINDESAGCILKALEGCQKLNVINLANNLLSDKIINNIINLLKSNYSISSCYFTNNNFSVSAKDKIKSYNRNGKIKIFI